MGEPSGDLNLKIGNLVKKGLPVTIQQALDIVRVTGNEAVHPGQLDLRDNPETATKLFDLVNIITDAMISQPKKVEELFKQLPKGKIEGITKRDGTQTP